MFDEFDYKPIASGSISQVYKAKFEGKKVAVKVRHPNVEKNIERDIEILFFFSKVFSKLSKKFEIPVNN
jgi:ubiquinone biosynthesis protein